MVSIYNNYFDEDEVIDIKIIINMCNYFLSLGFEEKIERKMNALSAALSQCEQQLDTRLTRLEDSLNSTRSSLETDLASLGNTVCAKLENQTEQLEELQDSNERGQFPLASYTCIQNNNNSCLHEHNQS